ncbi:hypothetical protein ABT218_19730 [Streptomyces sp. NPDC001455]|uniref:hypothetical protein n=1 Tax=Streptomyces sp. NPDC001455 TaxID=3154518 RepID=UPI0033327928
MPRSRSTSFAAFSRAFSGLTSEVFGSWGCTRIFSAARLRARSSAMLSRPTRFTSPRWRGGGSSSG